MHMHAMTIAALCLCLCILTCASAQDPREQREADAGANAQIVTAKPGTMTVTLDDRTRRDLVRHLDSGALAIARLSIRDVRPHAAQALKGVRIFIEKPDATVTTPVADAHYAGNFVLGLTAPESMLLNVAPTLTKLWQSGELSRATLDQRQSLRITLVSEPWDFAPTLPPDFSLTLGPVTLEIPQQP
jgi:hypothetical protein